MREVILSAAISLDGYIARPDGSADWIVMDPAYDFTAFFKTIDVVFMGRKTGDLVLAPGAPSMGNMAQYIFSRSKPPGKRDGVEYVTEAAPLVRRLKTQPGKGMWLMGGGEMTREFLTQDLVDRMDLAVVPVLLGEGIPLFPASFPQRNFRLVQQKSYPAGVLRVTYDRA